MAPISPSYVWEETETTVIVTATCRGATSASTDAFSSPHYVSVNSAPFFLELDLHGRIDSIASSTAVRRGGEIELRLPKAQPGLWGRLLIELPKPERLRRRAESRAARFRIFWHRAHLVICTATSYPSGRGQQCSGVLAICGARWFWVAF